MKIWAHLSIAMVALAAVVPGCRGTRNPDARRDASGDRHAWAEAGKDTAHDGLMDGGSARDGTSPAADRGLTQYSDATFANAPSNGWTSVDVKGYFPSPAAGTARINMYGVQVHPSGQLYYTNGERIQAVDANGHQRIDDYSIAPDGKAVSSWIDAWYIYTNGTGVWEYYDVFPSGTYDITSYPFFHGNIVTKGGIAPNVDSTASGLLSLDNHIHQTRYRIWMQDIKASVTTPAGVFHDVTMQAEEQDFCDYSAGACPAVPNAQSIRIRWYWAPGQGYIAMTSMDAGWKPVNTMYLLRTCIGKPTDWVCP